MSPAKKDDDPPDGLPRCADEVFAMVEQVRDELYRQGMAQAVSTTALMEQTKALTAILNDMKALLGKMLLYLVLAVIFSSLGSKGIEVLATHVGK